MHPGTQTPLLKLTGEGLAFVNGTFCPVGEATISVFDIGFTHSDVAYDVTSVWKGWFFRLDDHVQRFLRSCAGFRLVYPYGEDDIKRILATCVERGGIGDAAYVAVVVTRGHYTKDGERDRDIFKTTPTFIAYAVPYIWIADPVKQNRGLHIVVAKTPRIPDACVDMRFKNYHWGDLTQGRFEARDAGADNAVLCTLDGCLAEGPGFNVFFAADGRLCTPARNVLEGLTRQTVFDLARELGTPAQVGNYPAERLREADEAFICSTAGGIMPVVQVDGRVLGNGVPGPLTLKLRDLYWAKRGQGWLGTAAAALL